MVRSKRKKDSSRETVLNDEERRALGLIREVFERAPDPDDDEAVLRVLETSGVSEAVTLEAARLAAAFPHPFSLRILAELEKKGGGKAARRELRRSRYVLSQQEVRWQSGSGGEGRKGVYRTVEKKEPYGLMTPIDGSGSRLIVLVRPRMHSGVQAAIAVIHETDGIKEFRHAEMTRSGLRRLLKDMSEDQMRFVRTSAGHVCRLFKESSARMEEQGKEPPREYFEWKRWIEEYHPVPVDPPIFEVLSRESVEGNPYYLKRVPELFEEPIVLSWIPEPDKMEPYAAKLEEVKDSRLVLSSAQQVQRSEWILEEAVRDLFPGEKRELMRKRLEETAYVFRQQGREDLARISAAASIDVSGHHELIPEASFLIEMIRRSLFLYGMDERDEEDVREDQSKPPLIL